MRNYFTCNRSRTWTKGNQKREAKTNRSQSKREESYRERT